MLRQWVAPEIAFRRECDCDTCGAARELYYCEDETPMRAGWENWWAKLEKRRARTGRLSAEVLCVWQLRRAIAATAAAAQLELSASWGVAGARGPTPLSDPSQSAKRSREGDAS